MAFLNGHALGCLRTVHGGSSYEEQPKTAAMSNTRHDLEHEGCAQQG